MAKARYGQGSIIPRGDDTWRLRYRIGGKQYGKIFRGTKKDAQKELRRLLTAGDKGEHVEPTRITIADFVRARVTQWEAAGDISARTAARYRELIENQIAPHLGSKAL